MAYREFNLDKGLDIALNWASRSSEEDAYIFVLELPANWWQVENSPYSEVANAIRWDINDAITIAYEVLYEVGRDDIARFILTL